MVRRYVPLSWIRIRNTAAQYPVIVSQLVGTAEWVPAYQALQYFERAADSGNAVAMAFLGKYRTMLNIKLNIKMWRPKAPEIIKLYHST